VIAGPDNKKMDTTTSIEYDRRSAVLEGTLLKMVPIIGLGWPSVAFSL
jgi:hypothetical protein